MDCTMAVKVTQQLQGHTSKLTVSVIGCGQNDEVISRGFVIQELVKVRFKFILDTGYSHRHWSYQYIQCFVSAQTEESSKHKNIKVSISCNAPKYSHQWICDDNVLWKHMGKVFSCANTKESFLYMLEVNISVSKNGSILYKVYGDESFTDFAMSAPDGRVPVHKVVLAAHSDMFRTMFGGKWKETTEGCIEVEGATLQTLQHLKDYMYLGTLPEDGLQALLLLAKRYLIEDLKAECILRLSQSVTPETLFDLLEFASQNDTPELKLAIIRNTPDQVVQGVEQLLKNPQVDNDAVAE